MKKLSMILTVLVILGSSAIGHTSDECVVFEGTFEMSTRRPVAQFEYFQALDGEAIVRVYDQIGNHHAKKVRSANISINGKKVIGSRDFFKKRYFRFWHPRKYKFFHYSHFKQPDDVIEKTVELTRGQNSLEVMLNSRRGGKIKVVIVGPKFLASDDDGDEILMSYDSPCTGGNTVLCNDNCPNDFNPDQADSDGDGIGDVCDDSDDDAYPTNVIATTAVGPEYGPYGGIAVSPDGKFAYVSNQSEGTVYVIQTSDNTVVDTDLTTDEIDPIKVGLGPFGVSMTRKGEYVYVSNSWDGTVSIIRTEDNTVIDTDPIEEGIQGIKVGPCPYGVSVTPDGDYVYVCDLCEGKVYVIRTSDNTVTTIDDVGTWPYGVIVSPNGDFAYVSDFSDDRVYVIRTSDNTVIDMDPIEDGTQGIQVGRLPIGVSVTPNGDYVYVSNSMSGTVSVIRTSDNTVIDMDPIEDGTQGVKVGNEPSGVSVTPNGKYVYVSNSGDGTVSVIRTSDNTVIDTDPSTVAIDPIKVGNQPYGGIAVSPDGKSVYVGNYGSGNVSVIGF
jgi:YVTN family beta-propeller protein